MGEDCAQVCLMYRNCCFIKCYANIFLFCNEPVFIILSSYEFTNVPVSRFTSTLDMPSIIAMINGGAISEVDCV